MLRLEMCMEMGNAGFLSLPWDFHGNENKLLKLMGMGRKWE